MAKRVGGRGSAGGAYDAPPDPTPLSAFSASNFAPSRSILAFPLLLIYEMTTGAGEFLMFLLIFAWTFPHAALTAQPVIIYLPVLDESKHLL